MPNYIRMRWLIGLALVYKIGHFFRVAVVHRNGITVVSNIQGKILPHHGKAN